MNNEYIIKVLEASVAKNGEIALTNNHLLNILRMANKWEAHDEENNDCEYLGFEWWKDD